MTLDIDANGHHRQGMRHHRLHLGPRFSEGARLLWLAMGETPPADFQRSLGWAPGMLWNILYGERGAGRDTALLLFERHKIPIGAWSDPPSEPFIPPAARELEPEEEPSESEGAA